MARPNGRQSAPSVASSSGTTRYGSFLTAADLPSLREGLHQPPEPPDPGRDLTSQLHQQLWDWRHTYPACGVRMGRDILLRFLKGDISQWQQTVSAREAPSPLPQPVLETLREAASDFQDEIAARLS